MIKLFFTLLFVIAVASSGFCDNPPPPFNPGDPSPIPLDGGVSLLLLAGSGYGLHRIRKARKNKEDEVQDSE